MDSNLSVPSTSKIQSTSQAAGFDKQRQWTEFPSFPLERIYSFLNRCDQINMSQVCRKWSEGFNSPSVWKRFKFILKETQLSMDPSPSMKCAQKYSSMFQHVEIDFTGPFHKHSIDNWGKQFIAFLDILTRTSKLISANFKMADFFKVWYDSNCAEEVSGSMIKFLKSQHLLKRTQFHSCYFIFQNDNVLKELAKSIGHHKFPPHFVLRRFVHPIEPMDQEKLAFVQSVRAYLSQRIDAVSQMPTLQTDYSIIIGKESKYPEKIILNCSGFIQERYRGISSDSWRFLKQLRPDLHVDLYFKTDSPSQKEVKFLIVRDMPLKQLDYRFTVCKSEHSSIMGVDELFDHLLTCKANDHLVSLRLAWILPIPNLALTFIPFLQASMKLERLQLFIDYPANGIDLLARSWLENRPESLEKISIGVSYVEDGDNYTRLMNLVTEYAPLLEMVGLNLEIKLNTGKAIF